MTRQIILLKKFIGNSTSKCEIIEVEKTYISNVTYDIMKNKKLSLYIKRKNMDNLTFTINSTNLYEFTRELEAYFDCNILQHDVF